MAKKNKPVNVAEKSPFTSKNTIKVVCKFATVVAIAILVAMATNNALLAIPPTPPPDCPKDTFEGPKVATITVNGCVFEYVYWWRWACDAFYDTYIESFRLITDDPRCKEVFAEQYKKIVDAIMADVVSIQNPWDVEIPHCYGQDPCKGGTLSPTQWRFFRPSCRTAEPVPPYWGDDGEIHFGGYIPCKTDENKLGYCYKTYRYCWWEKDGGGGTILKSCETGGGLFNGGDCSGGTIIINDKPYRCVPSCEE